MWNIQYSLKYKYLDYDIEYGKIPNDATHCRNFEIISIDRSVYSQYVNVIELLVMYLVYHFCIIKEPYIPFLLSDGRVQPFFYRFPKFWGDFGNSIALLASSSLFLSASLSLAQLCFARLWKQWTSRVVLWLCIGQNNTPLYNTDTMGNGGTKLKRSCFFFPVPSLCYYHSLLLHYYPFISFMSPLWKRQKKCNHAIWLLLV